VKVIKSKQMTRWGVGPEFTIISLIYAAIIFAIQNTLLNELRFTVFTRLINHLLAIILIGIGLIVFFMSAWTIDKYYFKSRLCKRGVYAYLRHPIYGSWISFIVPGVIVLRGSILGITIPLFMYFVFRILIPIEENYLLDKFGDEYIEYKSNVWSVFPKIWSNRAK
jgi:protein-S-isoprenylcysteine O-methyltransferase Ste14